jgi:hypothetical protein
MYIPNMDLPVSFEILFCIKEKDSMKYQQEQFAGYRYFSVICFVRIIFLTENKQIDQWGTEVIRNMFEDVCIV